ncbi:helix-turn-helix transcriptional regulator [Janthinobacterium agaricidamnosum]|uniref:Bacterial regulatory helix-turn-helix s, AraC family protein n=1 Tax=Janthinobacterium agaricidamnosum NBRC 102515 = DSM 9628 TaxID=1349767 RepID=W0VFC2_9BURK|nr:helix-turn-helix transcriptional regulator [Janthinobacterium agaricidamnosum]CDG86057.1 bacterial regulatory helix-turn-helix s, AraC family protein [Janthinobacterium agaricidamnosum NBRC 102515 = DSM 9628]
MAAEHDIQPQRIATDTVQARQVHSLSRVPVFMPSLCRVRHGEKVLQWGKHSMRAGPQHLILMPAGYEFGVVNRPSTQGYLADVVSFPPELVRAFRLRHGALLEAQLAAAPTASLCVPLDRKLNNAWAYLADSLAAQEPVEIQTHHAEGLLLALSLAGHAGPLLVDRNDPLGARIQQLLLFNPAADWTVAGVASRLHLGASTLRRQLALEGRSFRIILEEVRLGVALQRLQTSSRPIGEIAADCGYASASRFAVRFRQHYGLSPRALRSAI